MRRVTEKHHGDRLGDVDEAVCNFPAVALLAAWSTLSAVVWSKCRWRLRSFFGAAFKRCLDCAASLRRTARVSPGRLVAQRCMKTGWCVLSSRSARPNWSLKNVWTPCVWMRQWNGRRGMRGNPVQSALLLQDHQRSFKATSAPERRRPRSLEFGVAEHVCNSAFGSHVKVTTHKVDVEKKNVRAQSLKERRGSVSFSGDHFVPCRM